MSGQFNVVSGVVAKSTPAILTGDRAREYAIEGEKSQGQTTFFVLDEP
jgi:hypothetical protein